MTLPLYMKDLFGYETGLALATVIGFFFGFVLERAGFGRAQNIVSQFYFTDMRVLKVMFTAVATAGLGLAALSGYGVLDMSMVTVPPAFLWSQVVGGLLVGAGMAVSGYCPGTCVVAGASGNLDGVATFGGIVVGSLLFGVAYPALEGLYMAAPLDGVLLFDLIGVPHAVLAAGVLLMAVGAFLGGEKVERIFARRNGTDAPGSNPGVRNKVIVVLGALGVAALISIPLGGKTEASVTAQSHASVTAMELAGRLVRDPSGVHLVDLRAPAKCKARTIPGAICLQPGGKGAFLADLPSTRTLVLFGQRGVVRLPAPARQFRGPVMVLDGGFEAFDRLVLRRPQPPRAPTAATLADYRLRAALYGHFTGARVKARAVTVKPMKVTRKIRKGGGC